MSNTLKTIQNMLADQLVTVDFERKANLCVGRVKSNADLTEVRAYLRQVNKLTHTREYPKYEYDHKTGDFNIVGTRTVAYKYRLDLRGRKAKPGCSYDSVYSGNLKPTNAKFIDIYLREVYQYGE